MQESKVGKLGIWRKICRVRDIQREKDDAEDYDTIPDKVDTKQAGIIYVYGSMITGVGYFPVCDLSQGRLEWSYYGRCI